MDALEYNRVTGLFFWKRPNPRSSVSVGQKAGCIDNGYVYITLDRKRYLAHRLAWLYHFGDWPEGIIDHIDGNRSNNAINNLRDADKVVNGQNQKRAQRHNALGILGVTKIKGREKNPYLAQIRVNGKPSYLGTFPTAEAASEAYLRAKRELQAGCTI